MVRKPNRITFVIDLFNGDDVRDSSHEALDDLLDTLFRIDVRYLQAHPETPALYDLYDQGRILYQEEPEGSEDWQDIPTCIRLGAADCEDLACWRAAELVVRQGIQARPAWTCSTQPDGTNLYHIVVKWPDGRIEDPSRNLGMM